MWTTYIADILPCYLASTSKLGLLMLSSSSTNKQKTSLHLRPSPESGLVRAERLMGRRSPPFQVAESCSFCCCWSWRRRQWHQLQQCTERQPQLAAIVVQILGSKRRVEEKDDIGWRDLLLPATPCESPSLSTLFRGRNGKHTRGVTAAVKLSGFSGNRSSLLFLLLLQLNEI